MKIQRFGDWHKAERLLATLDKNLHKVAAVVLSELAEAAQHKLKNHLEQQDLSWRELSLSYQTQKQRKGLSPKILIASGTLRDSIKKEIKGNRAFVGLLQGEKNKEGQELAQIAATQEYGSLARNIPARKLWQPTSEEMKAYVRQTSIFEKAFIKIFSSNVFRS